MLNAEERGRCNWYELISFRLGFHPIYMFNAIFPRVSNVQQCVVYLDRYITTHVLLIYKIVSKSRLNKGYSYKVSLPLRQLLSIHTQMYYLFVGCRCQFPGQVVGKGNPLLLAFKVLGMVWKGWVIECLTNPRTFYNVGSQFSLLI